MKVEAFVKKLLLCNFDPEDIGVITPYHSQVLALRRKFKHTKKLRVGTVEEFQGEEKMVIVFSAVKTSGTDQALRFIYCPKRLNTAVSRARFVTKELNALYFTSEANENVFNFVSVCWSSFLERLLYLKVTPIGTR